MEQRRDLYCSYFVPIPATKKFGGTQAFDVEWTRDRVVYKVITWISL